MNSCFSKPMKSHVRLEFTKGDEDVEFFICQNMLSMPQSILGCPDYVVSHYKDSNTIAIFGINEDDMDLLVENTKEYAKQMRDQGIDTIEKIKKEFNRF